MDEAAALRPTDRLPTSIAVTAGINNTENSLKSLNVYRDAQVQVTTFPRISDVQLLQTKRSFALRNFTFLTFRQPDVVKGFIFLPLCYLFTGSLIFQLAEHTPAKSIGPLCDNKYPRNLVFGNNLS